MTYTYDAEAGGENSTGPNGKPARLIHVNIAVKIAISTPTDTWPYLPLFSRDLSQIWTANDSKILLSKLVFKL